MSLGALTFIYSELPSYRTSVWIYCNSECIVAQVFMVLRKKNSNITFLHVYHHAAMVFFVWATLYFTQCQFFQVTLPVFLLYWCLLYPLILLLAPVPSVGSWLVLPVWVNKIGSINTFKWKKKNDNDINLDGYAVLPLVSLWVFSEECQKIGNVGIESLSEKFLGSSPCQNGFKDLYDASLKSCLLSGALVEETLAMANHSTRIIGSKLNKTFGKIVWL